MRIRLHEIELFSRDTEASRAFYAGKLGFHEGTPAQVKGAFAAGT